MIPIHSLCSMRSFSTVRVFLLIMASCAISSFPMEKPEDTVYFPDFYRVNFPSRDIGYVNGLGLTLSSNDLGMTWRKNGYIGADILKELGAFDKRRLGSLPALKALSLGKISLHAVTMAGPRTFVCGDSGFIARLSDNERSWDRLATPTQRALRDFAFINESVGFAVGDSGTILRTMDGGDSWIALTRKSERAGGWRFLHGVVFPAPWYYIALGLILALMIPAFFTRKEQKFVESIEQRMVSDRPLREGDPDPLHFHRLSLGLSAFIRNPSTRPPLTVGIMGEWGSGKSSLMNLLSTDLKRYGLPAVWFNAWHHQNEQSILAALLENIRKQAVPPLFSFSGAGFRLRLLFMRFKSYVWWVVLALVASVFFFGYNGLFWLHDPSALVTGLCRTLVKATMTVSQGQASSLVETVTKHVSGEIPLLMYLSVLVTAMTLICRRLKAFGINPAALLAAFKKNATFQDLQSMAGFRQRFANELREVTGALSNSNLVVIIDDLDRCTPQNVLTVLEFVNFLVTSGELFVVMGINEKFVKSCVGLGMKDIAQEYAGYKELEKRARSLGAVAAHAPAAPTPAAASESNGSSPHDALAIRSEFAQNYLEKLINVKIQVPSPSTDQLCAIAREERSEEETLFSFLRVRDAADAFNRGVLTIAILAVIVFAAFLGGRSAAGCIDKARESLQTVATTPDTPDESKKTDRESAFTPAAPVPLPDAAITYPTRPAEVATGIMGQPPFVVGYLLVLLTLFAALFRLMMRIGEVPRDSRAFKSALEEWIPLVECLTPTPRGIKKFINSVRYMAMFQRSYLPNPLVELAKGNRWIFRLVLRIAGIKRDIRPEELAPGDSLPDDVLVGLSAIHFCAPRTFKESGEIDQDAVRERLKAWEFSRLEQDRIDALFSRIAKWNRDASVARYYALLRGREEKSGASHDMEAAADTKSA